MEAKQKTSDYWPDRAEQLSGEQLLVGEFGVSPISTVPRVDVAIPRRRQSPFRRAP
jgi:hypothetical protein